MEPFFHEMQRGVVILFETSTPRFGHKKFGFVLRKIDLDLGATDFFPPLCLGFLLG